MPFQKNSSGHTSGGRVNNKQDIHLQIQMSLDPRELVQILSQVLYTETHLKNIIEDMGYM